MEVLSDSDYESREEQMADVEEIEVDDSAVESDSDIEVVEQESDAESDVETEEVVTLQVPREIVEEVEEYISVLLRARAWDRHQAEEGENNESDDASVNSGRDSSEE